MFAVHLGLVASLIALFHAEDQPAIDELVKVLAPSVFVARTSDLMVRSPQTFHYLLAAAMIMQGPVLRNIGSWKGGWLLIVSKHTIGCQCDVE